MSQQEQPILDSEAIVRIIRQEWLVDGVLQQSAFTLKPQETYLSVNRPAVDTYDADVQSFVSKIGMLSPTGHISRCDPKRSYMKVSLGFHTPYPVVF